jgi:hypothetical protein
MNTAVLTYLSPKGRKISRDVVERDYAGILKYARKVASRPGVKNVKVWSQGGELLSMPRGHQPGLGA